MNEKVIEYVNKLSEFIPEFREYWHSEDNYNNLGNDSNLCSVFSGFSDLASDYLQKEIFENRSEFFCFIEKLVELDGEEANAVCTCFLENLLNRTPGQVKPSSFIPYLGEKSKEFCRAWDQFTGVKTEGL